MTSFDYTVLLSLQPPLNQGEIVFSNNNVYQLIAEMTNFRGLSRSDFTNYSFIFSVHPSNALDIIDINSHSIRFTLTNSDPSTIKLTAQGMENPKREESITIPIRKTESVNIMRKSSKQNKPKNNSKPNPSLTSISKTVC